MAIPDKLAEESACPSGAWCPILPAECKVQEGAGDQTD